MSIGQLARRVLGRWFPLLGAHYRALFVDLEKVVDSLPALSPQPEILDIGGGDGAVLNLVLGRYPRAHATMIDLSLRMGSSLHPDRAQRVRLLPGVSMRDYSRVAHPPADIVIVSDVLHHVPVGERRQFFADLRDLLGGHKTLIFVKDVEPGSWRATAGYLADRYISGDKQVELISQATVRSLLVEAFPNAALRATELAERDPPNYALICEPR
jgi:cyclopropane fatty-acyl-phospholipid synthase-like methyltransferase